MGNPNTSQLGGSRVTHRWLNVPVLIVVLLALLTGIAVGVGGYIWISGSNQGVSGENNPELSDQVRLLGAKISSLENRIENLSVETNTLENLQRRIHEIGSTLENMRAVSGEVSSWPVDEIYESSRESVVKIEATRAYRTFFGTYDEVAQGSGFVFGENGYILTNAHVIEGAENVLITFWNGEVVEASLIGVDPYSEVGVLGVDPEELETELKPLKLGDSSVLNPGDRVIAIGNPFGLSGTTTSGIVSQTGRLLETEYNFSIPAVIQIDASINPGNSGGPLLNFEGEMIGITTAIKSETGTFSGIGFAVPSNLVVKVARAIIENGEYEHPWIGVMGQDVTYKIAKEAGLKKARGFQVTVISLDSPASDSDLEPGDIILAVDNRSVMGLEDILSYIVLEKGPGAEVSFEILRDGNTIDLSLELGVRPPPE